MATTKTKSAKKQKFSARGEGKALISFHSTENKLAYLKLRGENLGMGYTSFTRAVINHWLLNGALPLDELESKRGFPAMPSALMEELKKTNLYHP